MTIVEAMRDPALFGAWFKNRESWQAWEAFLAALFGLPLEDEAAAALYTRYTGRATPPTAQTSEAWVVAGRRGGKSHVAALVAVYLACFRDYRPYLAPGEVGTLAVIAADRRQARTVFRYINGFIDGVPMLSKLVVNRTKEAIELANNVVIEVHTASFRAVRGYTLVGCIADEIAFWRTDDGSTNPDVEVINGLRPGMATVPGALLLCISSPYAKRGALWEAHRKHYGQDGDPVLVWQAPTAAMNPAVDPRVIAEAYEQDEAAAAAEYGAEFRRDIESFVSREAADACVVPGRRELPPVAGVRYFAFVDPSGGSHDSMTLAVAHRDSDGKAVLDSVYEVRPPFSPAEVVEEFAAALRRYGIDRVRGDRYAGEWPRERFREHNISFDTAENVKSDLYRELLPLLNSGRVELLDNPRLLNQLCSLERRTSRGGRDSIDHPPNAHDDLINAAAGALVRAAGRSLAWTLVSENAANTTGGKTLHPFDQQLRQAFPHAFEEPDDLTCKQCVNRATKDSKPWCKARRCYIEDRQPACDFFELRAPSA